MKRIFSVIVMILLISSISVSAFAKGVDVAKMTTDELLELRESINQELNTRFQTEPTKFYNGVYLVGSDIKAGKYVLSFEKKSENSWFIYVETSYADRPEVTSNEDQKLIDTEYNEGETAFINLEEGMKLEISGAESMTISSGEGSFWAP